MTRVTTAAKKKKLRYDRDGQSRRIATNHDVIATPSRFVAIVVIHRDLLRRVAILWDLEEIVAIIQIVTVSLLFCFVIILNNLKQFILLVSFLFFFFFYVYKIKKNVVTKKCVDLLRYTNKIILFSLVWVLGWWVFSWLVLVLPVPSGVWPAYSD